MSDWKGRLTQYQSFMESYLAGRFLNEGEPQQSTPAAMASRTALASFILVAAHREISPGSRPQACAAAWISARTRATFS